MKTRPTLILITLVCAAMVLSSGIPSAVGQVWTPTGNMSTPRYRHAGTLLLSGKVLVTGGLYPFGVANSAELYDPATGLWTPTGSMTMRRIFHTATLLPSGKVLVAGGYDANGVPTSTAELYDEATGTWMSTGSLTTARYNHTATLLA